MSSKRAKRKKRKEDFKRNVPNQPKPVDDDSKKIKLEKLPGQTLVKTGSAFLLVSALLSAITVWYAIRSMNEMNAEELQAITSAAHQTPLGYVVTLSLTSVAAVFQMIFGFQIFRKSNDPFYWKQSMIMSTIMILIELGINIVSVVMSHDSFNLMMLLYGTAFPLVIIWGSYKNKKFAQNHPDYEVPEPIKMF